MASTAGLARQGDDRVQAPRLLSGYAQKLRLPEVVVQVGGRGQCSPLFRGNSSVATLAAIHAGMFVDARSLGDEATLEADVCIVGAGAAGIPLALSLDRSPLRVLLIESGGFRREDRTQALYEGSSIGLTYCPLDESRSRFFGGSTNCWGGWCRPLDPIDLEPRDWVAASGWPFDLDELEPYYDETARLLKLGPIDFDPERWEHAIGRPAARLLPLGEGAVENRVAQISPPARFGRLYREPIRRSQNVTALLHANLVEILVDETATAATGLRIATLDGTRLTARARAYVLAMGGVENPRLLLASNGVAPAGVGNVNDLVGRYFMDHPRVIAGVFTPSESAPRLDFYDEAYKRNAAMVADGVSAAAFMSVRADVQREEHLLNSRVFFQSFFAGEDAPGTDALRRLLAAASERRRPRAAMRELRLVLRDADDVLRAAAAHFFHPARLLRARRLVTIVEPAPYRNSRVTLAAERDPLGVPRAIVDWRLDPLTERTIRRVQSLVGEQLERRGLGRLDLTEYDFETQTLGVWHHMGATRMSRDPATGVVDPDCRVHGMNNLYVAGSSVFPTVGCDMPTFTIVALALRLAAHLRDELTRRPRVAVTKPAVVEAQGTRPDEA